MASNNYWAKRMQDAQDAVFNKTRKDIDKRVRKYYQSMSKQVIADFESTYNKLLADIQAGKKPTPADLYKLQKYWDMQLQLDSQLTELGKQQIAAMTSQFKKQYLGVYNSLKVDGLKAFSTIDNSMVQQMINQIWCADGKSWSQRIWENVGLLKETLNEGLVQCVVTGKSPSNLKKVLQERFNVSYSRADALVRTELAHIQTQAAQQRYKDYGLQEVEVLIEKDNRTCEICEKHNGKRYPINGQMPVPFHPRCRCCMIPVIDSRKPVTAEEIIN